MTRLVRRGDFIIFDGRLALRADDISDFHHTDKKLFVRTAEPHDEHLVLIEFEDRGGFMFRTLVDLMDDLPTCLCDMFDDEEDDDDA